MLEFIDVEILRLVSSLKWFGFGFILRMFYGIEIINIFDREVIVGNFWKIMVDCKNEDRSLIINSLIFKS